jgi:hypothetical protein
MLSDRNAKVSGAEALSASLYASYLHSHLVFLLGTWLDDIYNRGRRYMFNKHIEWLATFPEIKLQGLASDTWWAELVNHARSLLIST